MGLLTYKIYKNIYPAYLEDCVRPYKNVYRTRRSEPARHMLTVPPYNYKQHKSFTQLSNGFFYSSPRLELASWDLSMCFFVEFVSCSSEDWSVDKVISAIAFFNYIGVLTWFQTCFLFMDNGFDYPNDCASGMRFSLQIRRYRNTVY